MNPKVNFFFKKAGPWHDEYEKLRLISLDCGLTEELKWGCPCYTLQNSNIVLIHGFKEYCALLFFKGALIKDPEGILIQQTKNVQSGRQIRFTSADQITDMEPVIKAYIHEAIKVEQAGLKVEMKKTEDYEVPQELQERLDNDPGFKTAFQALTPGRQRGYIFYFSQPKQAKTRIARIEKFVPHIMEGKGYMD